jgi:hypothetical protein
MKQRAQFIIGNHLQQGQANNYGKTAPHPKKGQSRQASREQQVPQGEAAPGKDLSGQFFIVTGSPTS